MCLYFHELQRKYHLASIGADRYIYGYDIKYILNGETHTAESVEFYIPFAPTSGPMVQFSPTGVLAKNGEVSIDNVTITIEYGACFNCIRIGYF